MGCLGGVQGRVTTALLSPSPLVRTPRVQAATGDMGLIPELGRSPGVGNSNPPQYSCLGNLMARGVWRATVHAVAKSWNTIEHMNTNKPKKAT